MAIETAKKKELSRDLLSEISEERKSSPDDVILKKEEKLAKELDETIANEDGSFLSPLFFVIYSNSGIFAQMDSKKGWNFRSTNLKEDSWKTYFQNQSQRYNQKSKKMLYLDEETINKYTVIGIEFPHGNDHVNRPGARTKILLGFPSTNIIKIKNYIKAGNSEFMTFINKIIEYLRLSGDRYANYSISTLETARDRSGEKEVNFK
jgi:hypothetical protein